MLNVDKALMEVTTDQLGWNRSDFGPKEGK